MTKLRACANGTALSVAKLNKIQFEITEALNFIEDDIPSTSDTVVARWHMMNALLGTRSLTKEARK